MSSSSGPSFNRSLTRVLRGKGIDERIKCTSTLVASYNAEEDAKDREALRKWLESYFDEFSQLRTGSIPAKAIAEFANLAEIKAREPADDELVRRVYTTLHQVVMKKTGCSVYFVLALEQVLSTIDNNILQEDSESLVALADRLIMMTNPLKVPLTRATFEKCASCLHALERVLMVLHDLEKDSLEQHNLKFFEDKAKKHLSKIISCQHYYPFAYQALLIKENIKKLFEKDIKSLLINGGRRAFYAFRGGLFIFQAVRELAVMKLDFSAMESGIGKFREAFKDIGWDSMTEIQEVVLAASETVGLNDFGVFQQCYDKYKRVSWLEGLKWSKQRSIRYAIVSHLCLFCAQKHSTSIQAAALELLVKLVNGNEGKQWRDDSHIFEAMIDALVAIGEHNQEYERRVIDAFNTISTSQTRQQKKTIDKCLNGMRFEERIRRGYKPKVDDTSRSLFHSTRQRLNLHTTASTYSKNQQTLKDHYMSDSFAKVSLFADENDQRHIKTFEFNLEEYKEVVVSRHQEGQSSKGNYNQRENNERRTTLVKKPLRMEDLYKKLSTTPHGIQENTQRVLVIGNPGTGKTCLSKRLCHDWATDEWGLDFAHVYLLPIRRLSDNHVGNCGDLPSIILDLIYQAQVTQDINYTLYEEVRDNLSEATTLLILDGYDEAGDKAKDLVSLALTLNCSLLILSRPHSIQAIRPRVGFEVECLELSAKQLESFVRGELGSNDGEDLLEFFSRNLSIKYTCQVAVNLQIITKLWKSSFREELIKSSCANITSFYNMTSKYLWDRFTFKEGTFDMNKTFVSLERIALEAFEKGQVEIPEHLILKHAQESTKVFCASGFLLFVKEGTVFQFAHLTFHEYFAGRYLAKMLISASGEERKRAEQFISEHKYIETSRVMLSFMTQCYCKRESKEGSLEAFKDLMEVLNKDPLPSISLQHLFLRMRTLDAFLPCGLEEEVHTNDVVMKIVNDAMDALKRWFGSELGDEEEEINWGLLQHRSDDLDSDDEEAYKVPLGNYHLRAPIIDELARMPSLFNRFPTLLKPILLNWTVMTEYRRSYQRSYRLEVARVGRLNPHHALQCILPMLDDAPYWIQTYMIELCAFIGPMCAEPALDHLKRLCRRQRYQTRATATRPLVAFIDLFPEREDVRQLMVDLSRDPEEWVRYNLMESIEDATFTQETEAKAFVWDLLIEATKDNDIGVRRCALESCVQHYQTFARSVDEVMELVRELVTSPDSGSRSWIVYAIKNLTRKAPEKSEELLVLLTALCRDPEVNTRINVTPHFQDIAKSSLLRREDLFNVAFDLFKDGYPDVQVELLPFLFSFDKKENHCIDEVNEWIANCQDLDEEVRAKAVSCSAANALLSEYTIEEIHDRFYDQDYEVQFEIVTQFAVREIESNNGGEAIAKMALRFPLYDDDYGPFPHLWEELSKTELFPNIVLEDFAICGLRRAECLQRQPLSHLLEYYWSTKDANMIRHIARKLLLSSVIFEKKRETEMEVSLREKGVNVKQTVPVGVVQDLLSRCKDSLKEKYGLDFQHD